MWRQPRRLFSYKTLPLQKPLSTPKALVAQKSPSPQKSLPPQNSSNKRLVNIIAGFCAGFAIYFFLDEPVPRIQKPSKSPRTFVESKVISNEASGPNTKLLKIAAPLWFHPGNNTSNNFNPVWSVFIKDDDIQVERPYTPLLGIDKDGHMLFWIKKYPRGEVGRWLHTKGPGDSIEFRGPLTTWPWKEDTWDDIVMISGGTGITPFVQFFHSIISKSTTTSRTRFILLHSSRVPEELPPAPVLDPLVSFAAQNPQRFKFHVFVDERDGSEPPTPIPRISVGRITEESLKRCLDSERSKHSWWDTIFNRSALKDTNPRSTLFLVCGPEPMIAALAGPYGRNNSQGSVGGILGKMGYASGQVYKL